MRVRATAKGFFGGALKSVGDEFHVEKHEYSERWMECLDPPKAQPKQVAEKPKAVEPQAQPKPPEKPKAVAVKQQETGA